MLGPTDRPNANLALADASVRPFRMLGNCSPIVGTGRAYRSGHGDPDPPGRDDTGTVGNVFGPAI